MRTAEMLVEQHVSSGPDVSSERRCLQTSPQQLMATKDPPQKQKLRISVPRGSGVSLELEQKFKNCKNA